MTDTRRLIATIDSDLSAIISMLPAALKHLEDWTGEYPGSTSGAAPSSAPSTPRDDQGKDEIPVPMTRIELMAFSGDHAMRLRLNMLGALRSSSLLARSIVARVDGVELPVTPTDDASDLAVLLWAVKRIRIEPPSDREVDLLSRSVRHVHSLVLAYQPPTPQTPTGCRVHRAVGDLEPIYRADRCRGCWEFRRQNEADPSPEILRAWSKGIKPTAAQIAEAKQAGRKKRRKRKAST